MGRLKSRMQRNADLQVNQIDDIFAKKIVDAYIESIVDEFKKSKYIKQIPEERTEEFYDFVKDRVGTYRSINEFDFLINPIVETINKAAKEAVSNAGDIDVEDFLNS